MKIAFVIYDLGKGGAERVVSLLSNELVTRMYEVDIVLFNNTVSYNTSANIIKLNIPYKRKPIMKAVNLVVRTVSLFFLFRRKKYDKIFAFMPEAYVPSILTGFPIVASERNNPKFKRNIFRKFVLSKAAFVIAVSNGVEAVLKSEFSVKRVRTIYSPVQFGENLCSRAKIPIQGRYILAVGRLSQQKNFSLLIKAYSVSNAAKHVSLVIVGEGSERPYLEKLICDLGLGDKVVLLGQIHDVEPLYHHCEFLALSSLFEGVPNVLLEAFSCSKTAVATDCPYGPSEILSDGVNGLLVKNNDVIELSEALNKLQGDSDLRRRLEANAKHSVKRFKLSCIVDEWLSV